MDGNTSQDDIADYLKDVQHPHQKEHQHHLHPTHDLRVSLSVLSFFARNF